MKLALSKIIGNGNFSCVLEGTLDGKIVAVKRARHLVYIYSDNVKKSAIQYPILRHEACALVILQGHPSIPHPYAFGTTQYFQYLVLPKLGKSLYEIQHTRPSRLTIKDLGDIASQMLSALSHLRQHRIVHCDINLGNIVSEGGGEQTSVRRFYLIDYGLCKLFNPEDYPDNGTYTRTKHLKGHLSYASLNCHERIAPAFRDDVESLSYCLLALLRGNLPWYGVTAVPSVYAMKKQTSGAELCGEWDPIFSAFLDYSRQLHPRTTPNYQKWIEKFHRRFMTNKEKVGYTKPSPGVVASPLGVPSRSQVAGPTGARNNDDHTEDSSTGPEGVRFPDDPYVPSGEFEWIKLSHKKYMLGDEGSLVLAAIPQLDEVPEYWRYPVDDQCPLEQLCNGF
ncbi:kinase-like domain-containing protein [Daedaleopsis nitida]|nr:kinase-like domain-containing protein [Daedaleopsis nitida]